MAEEIEELKLKIKQLERHQADLEMALLVAIEHGDAVENQLLDANALLKKEIRRREYLEIFLKKVARDREKEKQDLQIILDTLIEHGDAVDNQWRKEMAIVKLLAETDGLTLIANRRRFDSYLTETWQQLCTDRLPLTLILCDVDFFKLYNDEYGHPSGDACLKRVAHALSSAMRSEADLVCRYGGEEFGIILPNTSQSSALPIADRIKSVIEQLAIPHCRSKTSPFVSLSMGIATTVPSPDMFPSELVEAADQMLYQAKQKGRNCYISQEIPCLT
jgi:diguanylate cyclase (GGDEF)-like protein